MTYRNSKVKRPEVDWPDSKHLILTCKTRDTGGSGIRDTVLKEGSFCSFIFTAPGFLFGLQYFNFSWFPIWKRRKFGKEESVHTGSWKSSKNHRDLEEGRLKSNTHCLDGNLENQGSFKAYQRSHIHASRDPVWNSDGKGTGTLQQWLLSLSTNFRFVTPLEVWLWMTP